MGGSASKGTSTALKLVVRVNAHLAERTFLFHPHACSENVIIFLEMSHYGNQTAALPAVQS